MCVHTCEQDKKYDSVLVRRYIITSPVRAVVNAVTSLAGSIKDRYFLANRPAFRF